MTLTIELPDNMETALKANAHAKGVSAVGYAQNLLLQALSESKINLHPKKSAYGLLAQYGPGPSEEEIDENRREMFQGFGESAI